MANLDYEIIEITSSIIDTNILVYRERLNIDFIFIVHGIAMSRFGFCDIEKIYVESYYTKFKLEEALYTSYKYGDHEIDVIVYEKLKEVYNKRCSLKYNDGQLMYFIFGDNKVLAGQTNE